MLVTQECRGCWRSFRMLAGMLATVRGDWHGIYSVFEGRATWHQKPVARPGRPGMFWGPSVWAGLRANDAGNLEEDLGVQQNTIFSLQCGALEIPVVASANILS